MVVSNEILNMVNRVEHNEKQIVITSYCLTGVK